jgi:hypothetical protein
LTYFTQIFGEDFMAGYDEKMTGQAERLSGHPNSVRTEMGVDSETRDMDMHIERGGANDTYLNKAVAHLNRETQRGEHAPMVGGYKHDDTMR